MADKIIDMFTPHEYQSIDNVEVIFDGNDNALSKEDIALTPIQVIKKMAKTLGQEINDPDPKCKKCYGLGYIGRDSKSKAPIPCLCMYSKDALSTNDHIHQRMRHKSRAERREIQRLMKKEIKKQSKIFKNINVSEDEIDNV